MTALLAFRVLLAAVFAVAAAAKLGRPGAVSQTLVRFGLPSFLAPAAVMLAIAEAVVAVGLLSARYAWPASLAALVMLAAFTVAIAVQLAQGRRPECNCFGSVHAKPIGRSTLLRNAALLSVAGFIAVDGRSDAGAGALGWPLLALGQAVLIVAVLRRHGRVLARLDELEAAVEADRTPGLAIGSEAPELALPDLDDEVVTLTSLRSRALPVLLLFSHPACGPCAALLPQVARWQAQHVDDLVVAVISSGDADVDRALASEHGLDLVLRDDDDAAADAYGVTGTPMALLVDRDGRIASETVAGAAAIGGLVSGIARATTTEVLLGV
jgi:methylamine dehydrogenase accessory protein MauD